MECVDPLLMTGNPVFMRFRENMVDARQNVRPVKQRLQQVDLGAFDIHLQYSDVFIEILQIADKVNLPDLDGALFGDILLAGNDRTRFRI